MEVAPPLAAEQSIPFLLEERIGDKENFFN